MAQLIKDEFSLLVPFPMAIGKRVSLASLPGGLL